MTYPKRVFLIDDDDDDCLCFNLALDGLEYKGERSYHQDGKAALELLFNKSVPIPDMIFLDWNMPKFDGRQCLAAIRRHPLYISLPIIILTTSASMEDKEDAFRLGATYFLSKPSSILELQKKLQFLFTPAPFATQVHS